MSKTPHTIDASDMISFINAKHIPYASATTADRTQRKMIGRTGTSTYIVTRCYFVDPDMEEDVVYEGTDPVEAARRYNGLG